MNIKMTKLMEWLCALFACLAIWIALLHNQPQYTFLAEQRLAILIAPLVLIAAFGVSSHHQLSKLLSD